MTGTFFSGKGDFQQYVDGNLVNNITYDANYNGDTANLYFKHNDQEYYTELDEPTLLELLNLPGESDDLTIQLLRDFPIKKTVVPTGKRSKRKHGTHGKPGTKVKKSKRKHGKHGTHGTKVKKSKKKYGKQGKHGKQGKEVKRSKRKHGNANHG